MDVIYNDLSNLPRSLDKKPGEVYIHFNFHVIIWFLMTYFIGTTLSAQCKRC
jgi:hypothetical protein